MINSSLMKCFFNFVKLLGTSRTYYAWNINFYSIIENYDVEHEQKLPRETSEWFREHAEEERKEKGSTESKQKLRQLYDQIH